MKRELPSSLKVVRVDANTVEAKTQVMKKRLFQAEWMENPDAWNASEFIEQTSNFIKDTYGIEADQDRHLICMLADQIAIYIQAKKGIAVTGIVAEFNGGKTMGASPYFTAMKESMNTIIRLMGELGLTPKGRIVHKAMADGAKNTHDDLLEGPKSKK